MSDIEEAQPDSRRASRRVADLLLRQIQAGTLQPGEPLPPYRQIANAYGVVPNTAMAAVRLLRDEGYVSIKPNSGARVLDRSAAEHTDVAAELAVMENDLSELRTSAQRLATDISTLESRVSDLSRRVAGETT
ncbi:winged helix-turn-helix domain-containing protein [Amycolatopsis sp. NPDC051903]|uniref:winged helix-turn-helix domain-containing protein n=1 Tax=Amycolatopsis sp. NPDC051903 TaxID=3363936 RepID=UPI0037B63358